MPGPVRPQGARRRKSGLDLSGPYRFWFTQVVYHDWREIFHLSSPSSAQVVGLLQHWRRTLPPQSGSPCQRTVARSILMTPTHQEHLTPMLTGC